MFYGGRLLSHLSAKDVEVEDFIELRKLNRHLAIVIDSDKKSPHAHVNETKRRVLREFDNDGGFGWITMGREVENYIEPTALHDALRHVYGKRYEGPVSTGPFDHALHFYEAKTTRSKRPITPGSVFEDADKIKIARAVCEHPANLDILDLRKRVGALIDMIHLANS
jgi:hypothetical protein